MRLPRPHALLTTLRDPRRWKRWGTEALILIAIVGYTTTLGLRARLWWAQNVSA